MGGTTDYTDYTDSEISECRPASLHLTQWVRRIFAPSALKSVSSVKSVVPISGFRFKGLGEISAGEFKDFIGENIRLDPVNLHHLYSSDELLFFFTGKNTQERQEFIIENLRVEKDLVETVT